MKMTGGGSAAVELKKTTMAEAVGGERVGKGRGRAGKGRPWPVRPWFDPTTTSCEARPSSDAAQLGFFKLNDRGRSH